MDSTGQTIDFLLTEKRDTAATRRFFRKALSSGNPVPRVINVDKNRAYAAAIDALKEEGSPPVVRLRQCKFLNNVVEQDHRFGEKADVAGERLWIIFDSVADLAGHRSHAHDPEGPSAVGNKK